MARSVRFDCQRLEVFGQAVEAVAVIDDLVEELPEGRAYIRDQLRRAANSIALNIAEGAGEFVPGEKARFYRMAKRSATECAGQILVCERLGLAAAPRMDAYISTQRQRHGAPPTDPAEPPGPAATPQQRMRHKVSSPEGRAAGCWVPRRKCLSEPVFDTVEEAMGFRRFSMRGLEKARGEWGLVCMCHNVRRLHAARVAGRTTPR
jgi:four helix bundle protein